MKIQKSFIACMVFAIITSIIQFSHAYEFHWEIDETPEGQESVTLVEPVKVNIFGEQIQLLHSTATYFLYKKYSVYPDLSWDRAHTDRLLKAFESIPQTTNGFYRKPPSDNISVWTLTDQHIQNDITIEHTDGKWIVTISKHAFVYANPLLAEIEGIRRRYFSKRLHRAVVRFVTENGTNKTAIKRILRDRYAVSINVPDYVELTQNTTGEHAGRFSTFKCEELIALMSMLEEYPSGMLKTPGLKYLVRRLDGTSHPLYPGAPAVAWTNAGYIEFMESAFKEQGLDSIHRLILHEKAHFMWKYLFDEQLKQDWIELGGWYENPDDPDRWSTTKQTEFVSAYAHGVNPNEDMAESISLYIVRPDKLRSRSPAKYEFIQNRIMHGTRYISKIREDLTFEVYNLYPDYVYPGKIVRVNIWVEGEPEEDKELTIEVELHNESDYDKAHGGYTRIFSGKNSYLDVRLYPIDSSGQRITSSHILRSSTKIISKYAANGYWIPNQISIRDENRNERYESPSDFGWQMYIDNLLVDCYPPEYVPNSLKLSLRKSTDSESAEESGEHQIVTVTWLTKEKIGLRHVSATLNDDVHATSSRKLFNYGYDFNRRKDGLIEVQVDLEVPDSHQSGVYAVNQIVMRDIAGNPRIVFFSNYDGRLNDESVQIDEPPATIEIHTKNPDSTPPVLDLENITITAEPTNREERNGETPEPDIDVNVSTAPKHLRQVEDGLSTKEAAQPILSGSLGTKRSGSPSIQRGSIRSTLDIVETTGADDNPTEIVDFQEEKKPPLPGITFGNVMKNLADDIVETTRVDDNPTEIVDFQEEKKLPLPRFTFGNVMKNLADDIGETSEGGPIDVVFVIDTSDSMGDNINAVSNYLIDMIDVYNSSKIDYALGLTEFNAVKINNIKVHQLTENLSEYKQIIRNIKTGNDENALDAIEKTVYDMKFRTTSKKHLILITDEPFTSIEGNTLRSAIDICREFSIYVNVLGLAHAEHRKIAIETDGKWHAIPESHKRITDKAKKNLLRTAKWSDVQNISSLVLQKASNTPIDIVLFIDGSKSMEDKLPNFFLQLKTMVRNWDNALIDYQIGVVTFRMRGSLKSVNDYDPPLTIEQIEKIFELPCKNDENLLQAIFHGLQKIKLRPNAQTHVIIVTDEPLPQNAPSSGVIQFLQEKQAIVSVIGTFDDFQEKVTQKTGGVWMPIPNGNTKNDTYW